MIIDNFFENLNWNDENSHFLGLANLIELVNVKDRWIYQGSLTAPPCTPNVYVNVLKTIYPIKEKHRDLIKDKLNTIDGIRGENVRTIQDLQDSNKVTSVY